MSSKYKKIANSLRDGDRPWQAKLLMLKEIAQPVLSEVIEVINEPEWNSQAEALSITPVTWPMLI